MHSYIAYGTEERQTGDLFLPESAPFRQPVVLIHGGGWESLGKEAMHCIARLMQSWQHPVYCINYRRLPEAPWPACAQDCERAARFLRDGGMTEFGVPPCEKILICGASAGGHLAMMAGLALGATQCSGIISMAGPSRIDRRNDASSSAICSEGFYERFFGTTGDPSPEIITAACPSALVGSEAPPLWCIHSRNDGLVPPTHSEEALAAWQKAGVDARIEYFDGLGELHGFWTIDDINLREPVEAVHAALLKIDQFLPKVST
jgi:acetyl esterase/lipase